MFQTPIVPFTQMQEIKSTENPNFMNLKREFKNKAISNIRNPSKMQTPYWWRLKLKQYFRVVFVLLKLLRSVRVQKRYNWDTHLEEFTKNFKLYREATAVWAVESIKGVIEKVILDVDGSLHFNTLLNPQYLDQEETEFWMGAVKSFVEDILIDLDEHTWLGLITPETLIFFYNFIEEQAHVPDNLLTKFELDWVTLDATGQLVNQSDAKKKMLLGLFIVGKLVVPWVFVKPESIGLDQIYEDRLNWNSR